MMKKYFYAISFIALIDPLISFALAGWVFSQNVDLMKTEPLIFCAFSFVVTLMLICCAVWLMANKPLRNFKTLVAVLALTGLSYFAIGIYSLLVQPIVMSSDFYTQLGAQDPDFFIRLLKSSAIQIWTISLAAFFMLFCLL